MLALVILLFQESGACSRPPRPHPGRLLRGEVEQQPLLSVLALGLLPRCLAAGAAEGWGQEELCGFGDPSCISCPPLRDLPFPPSALLNQILGEIYGKLM